MVKLSLPHIAISEADKIIACGDRNWQDRDTIKGVLEQLPSDAIVIEGAAKGADTIAGEIAVELGLARWHMPADWGRYGRAAGPIRNQEMLEELLNNEGRKALVVAFHDNIEKSKGTADMVARAQKGGVPTVIYKSNGEVV